jgi:phage terminase small subunit
MMERFKNDGGKKKTVKKKPENNLIPLPDGQIVDISALGLDDLKLTAKEKAFVFWYTLPGSDSFQVQTKAAVKAGYKANTAYITGYQLRRKPEIQAAINRILDGKIKNDVNEVYNQIIELEKNRLFFDMADFVHFTAKTVGNDKEGNPIIVEGEYLKDIKDLTPAQRMAIDGIDYKVSGAQSMKIYNMADREKAIAFFKDMKKILNSAEGGEDGEEETLEIIMERLSVKKTVRKIKDDLSKVAGLVELPKGDPIQEL